MKKINIKKVVLVVTTGFIIMSMSGCKEKSDIHQSDNYTSQSIIEDNKKDENYTNNDVSLTAQSKEEQIVSYFNNLEKQVNSYDNEDSIQKIEEKLKNIAITGIDFIFYDLEINGINFEELTDTTKEKIMIIVSRIDKKIDNRIPNYKETIKDKFGKGYSYLEDKLKQGLNYVDETLEEKYGQKYNNTKEKTSEVKEEVKENIIDIYETIVEKGNDGFLKIKNWYEDKTNKR